jgi:competence protein ComEA
MNFLFFKKKNQTKPAEEILDISVPNQTRLTYKPRISQPHAATVNPYLPASQSTATLTEAAPPVAAPAAAPDQSPHDAHLTLESVIECVPSEMLKPDLGGVSRSTRVAIPANIVIPQLQMGKIAMPLRELVARLPQSIFIAQPPSPPDKVVNLPLQKIIPQLPVDFFTPDSRQESLTIDDDFMPTPFGEDPALQPAAAETAVATAVQEHVEESRRSATSQSVLARVATNEPPIQTPAASEAGAAVAQTQTIETVPAETPAPNQEISDRATQTAEAEELFFKSAETETIEPIAVFEPPKPLAEVAPDVTPVAEPTPSVAADPAFHAPAQAAAPLEATAGAQRPLPASESDKYLININQCTAEDLIRIPGVGPALAQRIIEFRRARGVITDLNQLRQIPGIGHKTLRRIVGAAPAPRGAATRLVNYLLGAPQDKELTLQEIVRLTAQLPGVRGCILATEDGMFVTGQLPAPLDAQTISAFAPQLFRRVGRYVKELKVGHVRRFSLFTDEQPVSIFCAGKIYLVVIHAPNRFSKTLLNKCERVAKEINRICTEHLTV